MEEFGHWFGKMLKIGKILDDGSLRSCYMLAIMAFLLRVRSYQKHAHDA